MKITVNGFNPKLISQRMEKVKTVSSDGTVSFSGFESFEHVVLLNSMIQLNNEVPEIEKQNIIHQATFKAGAKGEITPQSLLAEMGKLEQAYLSTPEQKFKMLTEISVSKWCQFPKVNFNGSCIVVHAILNKASVTCRNKIIVNAKPSIISDIPKDYSAVSVSVVARSTSEAAEKARNRLDFIRGVRISGLTSTSIRSEYHLEREVQ